MSQQKAFYEMSLPKKKKYSVVVQPLPTGEDEVECQHLMPFHGTNEDITVGYVRCGIEADTREYDVYECACCGLWTCDDHISDKKVGGLYVCESCAQLSLYDIEEVIAFREKLNQP